MPDDYDDVTLAGIAKVPIRNPGDMRFTYAGTPHVSGPYIYVWPEDIEGVLSRYTHDAECATLLMRSGQQIPVCDHLDDVRTRLAEARRAQQPKGTVCAWDIRQAQIEVDPVALAGRLRRADRYYVIVERPRVAPCVVCGKETEWACADCGIDGVKPLPHVCPTAECRDKHEALTHKKEG